MSQKTQKLWYLIIELITPKIIEITQEKMDDFGIVSVVWVEVSSEYSYADIFVTSGKNNQLLPKFLAKYAPMLRSIVSRNIETRKIPALRFRLPKIKEESVNVLDIINEISQKYGFNKED